MVAVERNGIRAGKGSHEARTIEWAYRFPKRPEVDVDPLVPGGRSHRTPRITNSPINSGNDAEITSCHPISLRYLRAAGHALANDVRLGALRRRHSSRFVGDVDSCAWLLQ